MTLMDMVLTGTIIDTRDGEALVLTCGHLFRETGVDSEIEVDVFGVANVSLCRDGSSITIRKFMTLVWLEFEQKSNSNPFGCVATVTTLGTVKRSLVLAVIAGEFTHTTRYPNHWSE